jgi:uncharacterized LabA/DUF88 family protein
MKSIFFIDGLNMYHAIHKGFVHQKYKWLNLKDLAQNLIRKEDVLEKVMYFTAYSNWDKFKEKRHRMYVSALSKYGVQPIIGKFIPVTKKFNKKNNRIISTGPYYYEYSVITDEITYATYEEKRTDVNIATWIIDFAYQKKYEHAYVVTADGDIAPAIEKVKQRFPKIKFTAVLPFGLKGKDICNACDDVIEITETDLQNALFPRKIGKGKGVIVRPAAWA